MTEGAERHRDELTRWFGDAVRRHRERQDMSQDALARQMSARGWQWHQSTVYKTEQGKRKMQAIEVHDLAEILGVSMDRLFWAGPEDTALSAVDAAIGRIRRSWDEAATAIARLHVDADWAGRTLSASLESRYARVREAATELEAELADHAPESVSAEGRARWDAAREGDA